MTPDLRPNRPHPPGATGTGSWKAPLLLALLSVALYAPTVDHGIIYDDYHLIVDNESMARVSGDFSAAFALFGQEYWQGVNPGKAEALRTRGQALYRPLTLFLWACLFSWNDGVFPTWPFHLLSILVNALVVALFARLVQRLTDQRGLAFAAGLLFALHPLHSEATAYVAGLSDLLSAGAVFLGLLLFTRCARAPGRLPAGAFLGMLLTLFVGLLAKEQAILLVAAAVLTDFMLARRGEGMRGLRRVALYGGLLVTAAAHVGLRFLALGYIRPQGLGISMIDNPLFTQPFFTRLVNGVKILAMQVWLFLWPERLSIDYSFNAIPLSRDFSQAEPLSAAILLGVMLVFGLACMRRWPALSWGLLFFLGCALFTANILTPIGTIFGERLTYLPSAGAALAVAAALGSLFRGAATLPAAGAYPRPALVLLLAGATALGARTLDRNEDFKSATSIFEAGLSTYPKSARLHFQMASIYNQAQFHSKAIEEMEASLKIAPGFVQAALSLGDLYGADKNWDKAVTMFDQVLQRQLAGPTDTVQSIRQIAFTRRADAKRALGDFAGATADLRLAMDQTRGDIGPAVQLARMYQETDQPEESIPILREALARDPSHVGALYLLAICASMVGDEDAYNEALDLLEQTEEGRPKALVLRAEMIYEQSYHVDEGDLAEQQRLRGDALRMFDEARQADRTLATPYVYRGRFMAEDGRLRDAIIEFDRALERKPLHPTALLLKARAQLDVRRPKEALATLKDLEPVRPSLYCYLFMADAHFLLGQPDEMEAAYAKMQALGAEPVEAILDRVRRLRQADRVDRAVEVVEMGLAIPEYAEDPRLLRQLGVLLLQAERYDEALATLGLQEQALAVRPGTEADPYLPVNRARALMGLDRDAEAALQLELFEAAADPESDQWVSLLHRRAELFLRAGGPFFDPWRAEELCAEGLERTRRAGRLFDELYLRSIEARAAAQDLAAALERSREARAAFPDDARFEALEGALAAAFDGSLEAALKALRAPDQAGLERIADALERVSSGR